MTVEAEVPAKRKRSKLITPLHIIELLIILGLLAWHFGVFTHTPTVAIITSGPGAYWDRVEQGARHAAEQYDVKVDVIRCKSDMQAQIDAINNALTKNYDGIAVSPINAQGEATALASIAAKCSLVTLDSDSPVAGKLCFVGTDNYEAGRLAAQLVHNALPDGGEIIISIGNIDKQNTQRRRQGLIDELLDRSYEPDRPMDPVDQPLKGDKYTIDTTLVDNSDLEVAPVLVTKALKDHPDVKCFVGLLSYSAPAIVQGIGDQNKDGKIKVIGFDADENTLLGIDQGKIVASVLQDQYGCGYHSVRILGEAARGDHSQLPIYDKQILPCSIVDKENFAETEKRLTTSTTQPE